MHVTFIYPAIGRFSDTKYVRSWQMQPLCIAVLSRITPDSWEKAFFDDRLEEIDYDIKTDLVAISVETYTARRSYQIAAEFQKRGVPVIMGGYHATLCPQEVGEYADSVCIGLAENLWPTILEDRSMGEMQKFYTGDKICDSVMPDRAIFDSKNYMKLGLIETGRGCPYNCNFCSITAFHRQKYSRRPIADIVAELQQMPQKYIFFVDDNLVADFNSAKLLFRAIMPLKIKWISQASINMASDPELMRLMKESGCLGVLIGFESLCKETLLQMKKKVNSVDSFHGDMERIRAAGLKVYGTFMFGNDNDTAGLIEDTYQFADQEKIFLAAFNHIVPFPGTPLYQSLQEQGRLLYDKWWLSDEYRFGQLPYRPACDFSARDIQEICMTLRRRFYSYRNIFRRSIEFQANCSGIKSFISYWMLNLLMHNELDKKFGLPLGLRNYTERDNA